MTETGSATAPHTLVVGNPARVIRHLDVDPGAMVPTPDGPLAYAEILAGALDRCR